MQQGIITPMKFYQIILCLEDKPLPKIEEYLLSAEMSLEVGQLVSLKCCCVQKDMDNESDVYISLAKQLFSPLPVYRRGL
jgi:hypothetical protein